MFEDPVKFFPKTFVTVSLDCAFGSARDDVLLISPRLIKQGSMLESPAMELFWWAVTLVFMAVGLIGTVLPIFPGTTVILVAAIAHRIMLGPAKSLGWRSVAALTLLTILSCSIDFAGSWLGAKRFGATRWGTIGAVLGAIAGIFFGLPGLFLGPVVGVLAGEIIGGMKLIDAGRAGWGALVGNLAAMLGKLLIALAMVSWFLVAVPAPF